MEKKLSLIQQIPVGYKQSELGVIPEDWDVKEISKLGEIRGRIGWKGYTVKDLRKSGPYTIGAKHINNLNQLDLSDPTHLSIEKYLESPEIMVNKGDLLIVQRGTIGKLVLIDKEIGDATINPSMAILRFRKTTESYVYYYLCSEKGQNQILQDTSSTGVPMVTQKQISNFKIPIPQTSEEQTAIATFLSDTDTLIEHLGKLITKKKAIKQGTMQQLLTGKKRLPGFSGEWEVRSFVEVLSRINGKKYQVQTSDYQETGKYPVVDQGKDLVVGYSDRDEKGFQCPKGGVVVFGDHTCIVKFVDFDFVVGADGTQILVAKSGYCTRFYAFQLMYRGIATTGYNRHFKFLKERTFFSPDSKEQIAIAAVLSDMDAELESLKKKRDKYAMLKQGMMQQLLTGRIRIYANN